MPREQRSPMSAHPYLRAYMAGITLPTMFLLVIMTLFTVARYVCNIPVPIERVIVFPMAIVPNLWGAWNMLYLFLESRRRLPIGLHGAIIPFVWAALAFTITRIVGFTIPAFALSIFPFVFPVAVLVHYLLWQHLVFFLNGLMGVG